MKKHYVKPILDSVKIQHETAILAASVNATAEDVTESNDGSWE